jgi:hypothetical protein
MNFGWRAGAALSMGFYAWGIFLVLIRGPHCKRYTWFGYEGGLEARKKMVVERKKLEEKDREIASSFLLNGGKGARAMPMTRISEKTENGISV